MDLLKKLKRLFFRDPHAKQRRKKHDAKLGPGNDFRRRFPLAQKMKRTGAHKLPGTAPKSARKGDK